MGILGILPPKWSSINETQKAHPCTSTYFSPKYLNYSSIYQDHFQL